MFEWSRLGLCLLFLCGPATAFAQAPGSSHEENAWNAQEVTLRAGQIGDSSVAVSLEAVVPVTYETAEEHYERGLSLLKAGDALSASRILGEVLAVRPLEGKAHTNLARALLALEEVKSASAHAAKGVLYGPDSSAWNVMGLVLMANSRRESARAAFEKAISLDEANAWAHNNLGWLYFRAGKVDLAERYLQRAAQLAPRTPTIQRNLAYTLESLGRHAEAARSRRLAREVEPKPRPQSPPDQPPASKEFN